MNNKITMWHWIIAILFAIVWGGFFVASAKIQAEQNKETREAMAGQCEYSCDSEVKSEQ